MCFCSERAITGQCLGRRVSRTEASTTTVFALSGQQVICDYASGAAPATSTYRYVYASYIDEPIMRRATSGGAQLYYHRNQQYSIVAMTNSSGAVQERYAYTAYGVPTIANASGTVLTASAINNRYMYTGREWDNVIGQYYYRARMYDAGLGRFCSRDPIGYRSDALLYSYVKNAPTKYTDPYGLMYTEIVEESPGNCWQYTYAEETIHFAGIQWFPLVNGYVLISAKRVSCRIDPDDMWDDIADEHHYPTNDPDNLWPTYSYEREKFQNGCIGVASCMLGRDGYQTIMTSDCFATLQEAIVRRKEMELLDVCKCPSKPEIIGHTYLNGQRAIFGDGGKIKGYEGLGDMPDSSGPGGDRYDFGFFQDGNFFHAEDTFNDPTTMALISPPSIFHNHHNSPGWETIYCAACSGNDPNGK